MTPDTVTVKRVQEEEIRDFAERVGAQIEVVEREKPFNAAHRYYAKLKGAEVKDSVFLRSSFGDGATPDEAIAAYAKTVSHETLVFDAYKDSRREARCPRLVHTPPNTEEAVPDHQESKEEDDGARRISVSAGAGVVPDGDGRIGLPDGLQADMGDAEVAVPDLPDEGASEREGEPPLRDPKNLSKEGPLSAEEVANSIRIYSEAKKRGTLIPEAYEIMRGLDTITHLQRKIESLQSTLVKAREAQDRFEDEAVRWEEKARNVTELYEVAIANHVKLQGENERLKATLDGDPHQTATPEQRRAWRQSAVRYADKLEADIRDLEHEYDLKVQDLKMAAAKVSAMS